MLYRLLNSQISYRNWVTSTLVNNFEISAFVHFSDYQSTLFCNTDSNAQIVLYFYGVLINRFHFSNSLNQ